MLTLKKADDIISFEFEIGLCAHLEAKCRIGQVSKQRDKADLTFTSKANIPKKTYKEDLRV